MRQQEAAGFLTRKQHEYTHAFRSFLFLYIIQQLFWLKCLSSSNVYIFRCLWFWKCNKSNSFCYAITIQINHNVFDWKECTVAWKEEIEKLCLIAEVIVSFHSSTLQRQLCLLCLAGCFFSGYLLKKCRECKSVFSHIKAKNGFMH